MKHLLIAMMVLWAGVATAHSPLSATVPAHDAVLEAAPTELSLTFKGKIRLTRLTLAQSDQPAVDLELGGQSGFVSEYLVPLNSIGAGVYQIEWRGLGDDGHAMRGTFGFTVE